MKLKTPETTISLLGKQAQVNLHSFNYFESHHGNE